MLLSLVSVLGASKISFRAEALKALGTVIAVDPSIMHGNAQIEAAVKQRFRDGATSVREAAIDLVGRYVTSRPNVAQAYYQSFVERLHDKGLSVRKKAGE